MTLIRNSLFIIFAYVVFSTGVYSQGCSDAGFCTINSLKDHLMSEGEDNDLKSTLKVGLTYGIGDFNINIISPYLLF